MLCLSYWVYAWLWSRRIRRRTSTRGGPGQRHIEDGCSKESPILLYLVYLYMVTTSLY